ncbi:MAG TPA: ABC transporter substrate-binding protein [Stellaceae bacterium]|nr:ABC transporter substrate-binding protein [Stellaceae bacterium]
MLRKLITATVLCAFAALPAQAATKLNFMYTAVTQFVGLYVAKDQGMLAKHGLDIDMTLTTNGSLISAALVADTAQLGGPTPTVLLQANEQDLDLVVVAGTNVYPLSTPSGVVAAADSNLHGAKDLEGKRVGVPGLGGIIDVLTRKWVQSSGLDYHKVNWVEIGFPQMADALKSHLVDAVASVDPFYTRVIADKTGYDIGTYASVIPAGTSPVNFVATRAWAEKNLDTIKALQAALDEAAVYIKDPANDKAVRASVATYTKLPQPIAAVIDVPKVFAVHITPDALAFWVQVSREQGLIKGNPDPKTLIYP